MHVEFSPWVEGDLEAIADYIAQDNPARVVGRRPQLYRLRPEIGKEARIAVVGRYILLFRIDGEAVRIERVVFGGRNLSELLDD
jgi:toxin ParE1/3/4